MTHLHMIGAWDACGHLIVMHCAYNDSKVISDLRRIMIVSKGLFHHYIVVLCNPEVLMPANTFMSGSCCTIPQAIRALFSRFSWCSFHILTMLRRRASGLVWSDDAGRKHLMLREADALLCL